MFPRILLAALIGLAATAVCTARAAESTPAGSLAAPIASAQKMLDRLKPEHPRLLIDAAGFTALQSRLASDAALRAWDKRIVQEADQLLKRPLPRHVLPDGKRLLSTSRAVLSHVYTLALTYRLHGDNRYRERLWQEVQTVAEFPDFNPSHFLDTAEMTHALAIAYDWLFDTWTDSQRTTIRRAIVEMGLKPGLRVYRSGIGWPQAVHNWNQVCNGGMTIGALAVAEDEPQLAGEILANAIQSLPRAMNSYAPEGAWSEGPMYWEYATSYNVLMLAVLQSALGSDFNLAEMPGFAQTGLFPIYVTGPTGRMFNFCDSSDRPSRADFCFWLGRRFNLPICNWYAVKYGHATARAMIWYQEPTVDPLAAGLALDKYWHGAEVVTMRSAWNNPRALFVGVQAGSNRTNHNHLDLGSFVRDALGQRWVVDLGGDNYNLPGYFGLQRYQYYRLRAEGHNTLVINPDAGLDQDPRAAAKITRFRPDQNRAIAVADLSPAYAKDAKAVQRGLAMLDRRAVLLQDEIEATTPIALWWFVHTPARVTLSEAGHTAMLEQNGEKLVVRLLAPAKAEFEVRPAAPLPTSPNPVGQAGNSGVQKLGIHLREQKNVRLAVVFLPLAKGADVHWSPEIKPLAQW
jgi:hypothetical protein